MGVICQDLGALMAVRARESGCAGDGIIET